MTGSDTNEELTRFLAHSLELESEAFERYGELADTMDVHHNGPVAEFFRRMAVESGHHLQEVRKRAGARTLPELKAWEFDWPAPEPPETVSYEALHYRMGMRQAMRLAHAHEAAAEQYYRQYAERCGDAETASLAIRFANEEEAHATDLARLIAALSDQDQHLREEDDEPHIPE